MRLRQTSKLRLYVVAVSVAGIAVLAALAPAGVAAFGSAPLMSLVIAASVIVCELRPINITYQDESGQITLSTPFAFALMLASGTPMAVVVLAIASLLADIRHKPLDRVVFNIAQYSLSLGAAGAMILLASGSPALLSTPQLSASEFGALLLGGGTFFLLNNTLTGTVVALAQRIGVYDFLRQDFFFQTFTTGVLLALAPIVVVVAEVNVGLIPLLVLPVVAVYRSATASLEKDHIALHDVLTDLPNRRLFLERLTLALREAKQPGEQVAVLLIDLDRFKEVNDTLGHHMGDLLLQAIGPQLQVGIADDATVARLGGDEFALCLPDVDGADEAVRVAKGIVQRLTTPFHIGGFTLDIGASVGIALYPDHGEDVSTVMQRADVAMYVAKEAHGGFEVYSAERDPHRRQRITSAGDLRRGIETGQLAIHYQPKADMRTGLVGGVEALVRWQHPDYGLVGPDEFIPLAERAGLIGQLTTYVLDAALCQCRRWFDEGLDLRMAVNLSVQSLYDHEFPGHVADLLRHWNVSPRLLVLEITESTVMADPRRAQRVLAELSAMGVTLAIDDFGTGYSSLAYLKQLPVTELKIDKSFVLGMATDSDDAIIVHSTIDLAQKFGLQVVAEGVESMRVWQLLARLGCDHAQGYYVSRPLAAPQLTPWLRSNLDPGLDGNISRRAASAASAG
ncbi:MAG: EAL domain-containing protein [Actinomycetota bacterium]|nr:EAL domain-containing protein [Actinomycetota bacterium]